MSDKTENPTPKRMRESREKGDICKSQDLPSALTVFGLTVYLMANGEDIFKELMAMVYAPMYFMNLPYAEALGKTIHVMFSLMTSLLAPVIAFVMAIALFTNLAQVGVLFTMKAAMPKLENISPSKWFKKTFSMNNLVEFVKNLIKVSVVGYAAYHVLSTNFSLLFHLQQGTIYDFWTILGHFVKDLLFIVSCSFLVLAALDFLYQKWKYNKDHMMSKDEVKREYKESEGDPQIKGKRKQLHQELVAQNNMGNVRKAKVLVTNPTHYAIALDYEKGKTPLPILLAKGEGYLAQRMIKVAEEEGIPIMRNVPLARELFRTGTENSYIPKDLIKPVAEVLRWVQTLQR